MAAGSSISADRSQRLEEVSTRITFFIAGFAMSSWAPLVPFVKQRLALDDGELGLVLLCLGGGSIVSMPLAGALAARYGCRRVLSLAVALICLALPLLATLPTLSGIVPALTLFGAGIGCVDCVVNIQAIVVERNAGRPLMSGFHSLFSLGGILGAAAISGILSLGASPLTASSCVVGVIVAAVAVAIPHLLTDAGGGHGPYFAIPRGMVLFIGVLCFVLFLVEGAMLDWSAVFLIQVRGMDPSRAGLAYASFSLAMTACRLVGDSAVRRLGRRNVVVFGSAFAAASLALAALAPTWWLALVGYALVGAGCSNVVPVLFTSLSQQKSMPENVAVPAITTLGYLGILAGPAIIGLVAHASSLTAAFLGLSVLMLAVAASGRLLRV